MSTGLPDGRSMWIRAFYGFNPEKAGYVGWTSESIQARALREGSVATEPPYIILARERLNNTRDEETMSETARHFGNAGKL